MCLSSKRKTYLHSSISYRTAYYLNTYIYFYALVILSSSDFERESEISQSYQRFYVGCFGAAFLALKTDHKRSKTVENAHTASIKKRIIHLKKNCFIFASKKRGGFFEFISTQKYKHKKKHFIKHFFISPIFLEKKTISCCIFIFPLDCLVYTLFVISHHPPSQYFVLFLHETPQTRMPRQWQETICRR